jgi:predicted aldo/keto reductase-like oxidoreductase
MIYNKFKDKQLSALGMGCMRLPCLDGDNTKIDKEQTAQMVAYALEQGVNYFDTAWMYHGGLSEAAIGEALSAYRRDSFYLATKFPGFAQDRMTRIAEIFEEQLSRCKTDYFDFYLFHNLCEKNLEWYLDPEYGLFDYLTEQKRKGRIKHLGFSTHGSLNTIKRFLEVYGKDMEFCQLQVNWLDWDFDNAREKVALAASYGIPVWVMEPVRGGKLVSLEPEHEARLRALRPEATMAEWAFRFIQSLPEVTVTLSGMSNFEQLRENVQTFATNEPLSQVEMETILGIADEIAAKTALPCTSCKYCTENCPVELDIPRLIELYNTHVYSKDAFVASEVRKDMGEMTAPSACIGCRACEDACPQSIKISEMMSDFSARLGE